VVLNTIDIIIIAILVIGIFMGYRRGIISTIINLAGYILAFIGVKMYSDELAIIMEKNPKISSVVNEYVIKNLPKFDFSAGSVNAANIQGQGVDVSGSQLWDIAEKFPFLKKPLETNILSKFDNVSDVFSHYIYLIISDRLKYCSAYGIYE
jgi:colicin V production protein